MVRLNTFEIFLLNPYGEVEAGSVLQGQVVLDCPEDIEVKEIVVHCFGKCRVQWVDSRSAAPLAEVQAGITPPVTAEENYINDFVSCFPTREEGNSSGRRNTRLSKGMHTFDFNFVIPTSAPASFITEHGFIKYAVRAQVHFPNKVETNVRYFTVRPVFDLNRVANIEESVEKKEEVEVNSLFHNWGKCQAKMSIPKRGFIHGDTIPVNLSINNESSKELGKARLRLRMVTKYNIKSQSCMGDRILAESRIAPVGAGQSFNICDQCLRIPKDIPASHLHGCKFMHVKYYIELFIRPSLLSVKKIKLCIKIHIGTIPISIAREQAYLRMREAPPKYEELPPSYHDAIRLHLRELQSNAASDQNTHSNQTTSSSERLVGNSLDTDCQNPHFNHAHGATCPSSSLSDSECLCSSVDSLISMEEHKTSDMKLREESENIKFRRSNTRRAVYLPNASFSEDLRIAVMRRNLARAREELPTTVDRNTSDSSNNRPRSSKKSFVAIINSFFMTFPLLVCHDVK